MSELLGIGESLLSTSAARLRSIANNIGSVNQSGHQSEMAFQVLLEGADGSRANGLSLEQMTNQSKGSLVQTGRALDLALVSDGYFRFSVEDQTVLSRDGRVMVDAENRLVSYDGHPLLSESGDPIVVPRGDVEILPDATVLVDSLPVDRIGVVALDDSAALTRLAGALFQVEDEAWLPARDVRLEAGAYEGSNVSLPDEMTDLMAAMRQAELGSQVIRTYDSLLERALTAFRSSR